MSFENVEYLITFPGKGNNKGMSPSYILVGIFNIKSKEP